MILNRLVLSFYSEVVLSEAEKKSLYDFLSMDSEKQKRYYLMLLRTAEGSETLFEQQDQNRTFLELSAKSILENGQQEIRYPAASMAGSAFMQTIKALFSCSLMNQRKPVPLWLKQRQMVSRSSWGRHWDLTA